jgi:putative addiction module component (TIGR02574 family)
MAQPLTVPPPGFDELPLSEQVDYVQELWKRIASRQRDLPSPEWHRDAVAAARESHRADPEASRSWDEVRAELEAKLKQR